KGLLHLGIIGPKGFELTSAVFPHPCSVVADTVCILSTMEKNDEISVAFQDCICLQGNMDGGNLPVTDLVLSVGYPQHCVQTSLKSDAGAGANAGSSVGLTFNASDHPSEIVWSPHRGLRLQFADSSLPENRSPLLWDVGPSNDIEFSPLQGITAGKPNYSHFVEDENFFAPCARDGVKNNVDKRNPSSQSPKCNTGIMKAKCNIENTEFIETMSNAVETSNVSANQKSDDIRSGEEKGLCSPIRIQTAGKAIISELPTLPDHGNEKMVNPPLLKLTNTRPIMEQTGPPSEQPNKRISSNIHDGFQDVDSGNRGRLELVLAFKNHNQSINHDTLSLTSNSPSRGQRELSSADVHEKKREMPTPGSNSAPHLEKLESSDENDLQPPIHKDAHSEANKSIAVDSTLKVKNGSEQAGVVLPRDDAIPIKASPINSRVHMCHRKGKEKALSDGDVNGRMSIRDDDSHESVESCNSAGLFSAGKKRWSFQQQLFVGSKRVKKQVEESPCSTSYVRQDSSFMTWISNIMRGLSKSDQNDTPLALTLPHLDHGDEGHDQKSNACKRNQNPRCKKTGFQNIFQSLYCPYVKMETRTTSDDNQTGEMSKKLDLAIRECDRKGTSVACSGGTINKQFFLSNENACIIQHERLISHFKSSHDCFESKDFSEYPLNIAGKELPVCASNTETSFGLKRIKTNADQKSACRLNPILPSQSLKISEATASVFTRRLDALKHIIPSYAIGIKTPGPTICFFCGRKGHDLHDCSDITESELEDLLKNVMSYDSVEEPACMCIRCFQLNHWAVACPTLSSKRHHQSECNQAIINNFSFTKLLSSSNSRPNPKLLESKENHQVGAVRTSSIVKETKVETGVDVEKKLISMTSDPVSSVSSPGKMCVASSLGKPDSCKNQTVFLQNFVNRQISELPTRIFETIKRLRISRADILKWMNSDRSLSQLDGYFLRLRISRREGLVGTGYLVASITGAHKERSIKSSTRPISVRVGGIKCTVESQYISNHDFLEDELMAWWCNASKSGSKALSEEELNTKVEERKRLGL
ncbi:LOW QUALITY PROTEIN: Plus-3 domain, partial [Dillenia turbinata]